MKPPTEVLLETHPAFLLHSLQLQPNSTPCPPQKEKKVVEPCGGLGEQALLVEGLCLSHTGATQHSTGQRPAAHSGMASGPFFREASCVAAELDPPLHHSPLEQH